MINSILSFGYSAFGALLYTCGNYQGAIDNYNLAIQLNSQDDTAYLIRGMARIVTSDYSGAIEDLSQAIQIDPLNAQAYGERGVARAALGENQAAIDDCNYAIQLNPDYLRAYYGRGAARAYTGDYPGALQDFTHLSRLQPDANSYYNLATLQAWQGVNAQAIKNLTKVVDLNPNWFFAYYIRGNVCYNVGDEQGANEDFKEAMRIEATGASEMFAEDEHAFWGRGLARHRLGNREGAIADLQKAAEIALKHKNTAFHQMVMDLMREINPEQSS
ncbi:MAG: tetratricopeptide repeat protein [Chlorogloeopsis fritschii C42_A2020_084]|uniref:tetratricopeptide repeat protein n=1 Tax=Chlorogloeopsis fritschii TaxID=1124 RepID=UPI0019F4FF76|nr:tetratricopeptide repeat protein [Chlorogloeopsis fritschii]MBF2008614.1 tetratricopeptide repeat protein [Chlorogloeopsis fritschii C42_A2020_084]